MWVESLHCVYVCMEETIIIRLTGGKLTTYKASVFEHLLFVVLLCSQCSKSVNDDTKDEVLNDDYYHNKEECQIKHRSQ